MVERSAPQTFILNLLPYADPTCSIYQFTKAERGTGGEGDIERVFKYAKVLEPLKLWKGRVEESVDFMGDMSLKYQVELKKAMLMKKPGKAKTTNDKAKPKAPGSSSKAKPSTSSAAQRPGPVNSSREPLDFHGFMAELAQKHEREGNDSMRDFCQGMAQGPRYGPSIMEELMKPPTAEELARCRRMG